MNIYTQILEKAETQNVNFKDRSILIPLDENRLSINGDLCYGRIFDNGIVCAMKEVDCPFSENGYTQEPVFYRIVDQYETWISTGDMSQKIQFYTIE